MWQCKKKSHTCEKGGAHLRSFFWHLWMNFKKPEKSEFSKNEKKIARDIIILHTCTKNHNHMRWSSWDTERQNFWSFWAIFYPFNPPSPSPNNPDNQNFEKIKKAPGDVITLDLCNKKHDHMMYAYSDMEGNRQFIHSFYPFRPLFALLPHCWPRKLKFAKYVENTWRYPFTHVYNTLRSYDAWFLRYKVQRTKFCHFGSFFALWPSQQPKKSKILKKLKKKGLEILSCYTYVS